MRILITDPDWHLLRHAYQISRQEQHDVAAECIPAKAAAFAKQWKPDLIIATPQCLAKWQDMPGGMSGVTGQARLVVTADSRDPDLQWTQWARGGVEILLKPLVHPAQLATAIAAAAAIVANRPMLQTA